VLSAGMPADKLNLDAFMAQAMEYEGWDDPSDRVRRFFNEINQTHPYSVRRVSEIMKWVQAGEYDRIIRGEYRRRDDPTDVRAEAGDAVNFYAERFRTIFRETGENIAKAGSQLGGVADQLADWIRARGGPGGGDAGGSGSGSGGSGSGSGGSGSGGSGWGSGGSGSGGTGSGGRPGADSPGGDVFGDEFDGLDDEA
jgi:hypothetical protein